MEWGTTPGLMFLKYCKNVIAAQNMPIYLMIYIFKRGVDASKANLLKMHGPVCFSCQYAFFSVKLVNDYEV